MPDDTDLLETMLDGTDDAATRKQILVDNPAKLYGFTNDWIECPRPCLTGSQRCGRKGAAIVYGSERLAYRDLEAQSMGGGGLAAAGIGAGDRVPLAAEHTRLFGAVFRLRPAWGDRRRGEHRFRASEVEDVLGRQGQGADHVAGFPHRFPRHFGGGRPHRLGTA